jgi:hypothetical protein
LKIEIEVTEAEIKDAIERKARLAIAEYNDKKWLNDPVIAASIKKYWTETVDKIVKEQVENSDAIRQSVIAKIEAKILGQVTALLKVKK